LVTEDAHSALEPFKEYLQLAPWHGDSPTEPDEGKLAPSYQIVRQGAGDKLQEIGGWVEPDY
jgi:hypothetical protein